MNWSLGINFYSVVAVLFNPQDLKEKDIEAIINGDRFHTYLIGKRKKHFFVRCATENEDYNASTFYTLTEHHDKELVTYKHDKELIIHSEKDGYYNITLRNQNVSMRDFIVINNFFYSPDKAHTLNVNETLPSDLEIMYIGQAFGKEGKRKIDDRLSNHEKLLQVALSIVNSTTTEEILIVGLTMETNDLGTLFITLMDDHSERVTLESMQDLQKKAQMRLSDNQALTVFEASMIRYFQPHYNTEYKGTFPKFGVVSYSELYKTKFDYCAFSIDTNPIGMRIYSKAIPERRYIHYMHFPLTTKDEKKDFFDYLSSLSKNHD
ncbi:MAG: hypothetical protein V4649_12360 [Bacteroidota bacterium]